MKKLIILLTALFVSISYAQDVVYTISAVKDKTPVSLDSILIENLSNETRVLFDNLEFQDNYVINLTQQRISTSLNSLTQEIQYQLLKNVAGEISVLCKRPLYGNANLRLYDASGKLLYENVVNLSKQNNTFTLSIPTPGFHILSISTKSGIVSLKVMGSNIGGLVNLNQNSPYTANTENELKTAFIQNTEDFSFELDDSIRVSIYKNRLYVRPLGMVVSNSQSLNFTFKDSEVEKTGISDAYVVLNENTTNVEAYDTMSGIVELTYEGEQPILKPGDVITVDVDTMGYLRKVVKTIEENGKITITTEQAFLTDVFVDKEIKLNTGLMNPGAQLKSTSSINDISKALTDKDGYIHPAEVILHDSKGKLINKSAVLNNMTDGDAIVPLIDFYRDIATDLYGKKGDNVHFYIEEGHVSLTSNAVFEFDLKHEGELDKDTKVKKGDLKTFKFYLDSEADFLTKLALDMSKSYKKEKTKTLVDLKAVTAKFFVGPVVVWITFDVDILSHYEFNADAALKTDWGFKSNQTLQIGGLYNKENDSFTPISEYTPTNTIYPLNIEGELNAFARLEIYPRAEIKFYGFFGPYAEIVPYVEGNYNAAFQSQITESGTENFLAWNSGIDLGLDFRVGTQLTFLWGLLNKEFGPTVINCFEEPLWKSPVHLAMKVEVPAGPLLGKKIIVKGNVQDLLGNPVARCPVYFEGDGSLSKHIVLTDLEGNCQLDWTVDKLGSNTITSKIYNANKEIVKKVAMSVVAKSDNNEEGLIAYYPFNGNANDESGNGNNGTVNGAQLTTDRFGDKNQAYSFDGLNDYFSINNKFSYPERTFSFWFNPVDDGKTYLVDNRHHDEGVDLMYNEGKVSLRFVTSNGIFNTKNYGLEQNRWNHILFTYSEKNKTFSIYIDNKLKETVSFMGTTSDELNLHMMILNPQKTPFLKGKIDDIRLYNYVLPETEISSLYKENGWTGNTSNDGLKAHYPFNGNANDDSGNGNDGTVNGATLTSDRFGVNNSAYSFDGNNDFIQTKGNIIEGAHTISVWFKTNKHIIGPGVLLSSSEIHGEQGRGIALYCASSALVYGKYAQQSGWNINDTKEFNINDNKWHNATVSWDGTVQQNTVKLFIDGELTNQATSKGSNLTHDFPIKIGYSYDGPNHYYMNGAIDDIRIYNYALSQSEILSLYKENGWTGDMPNGVLEAYFPFNGNADDESGNGNNGEVNNAFLTTDRFGNENSAYEFNGINDWIKKDAIGNLNMHFTIAGWVYISDDMEYQSLYSEKGTWSNSSQFPTRNRIGVFRYPSVDQYFPNRFSFEIMTQAGYWNDYDKYQVITNSQFTKGWHFVVAIRNTSDLNLYIDNKLQELIYVDQKYNANDFSLRAPFEGEAAMGLTYRLGNQHWSGSYSDYRYGKQKLDDIRIYNYALSQSEISSLYKENGWTGDLPNGGLEAYFSFNGNANDESGNGNDAASAVGVTTLKDAGIIGTAPYFNGTSSAYILCGNDESLDITGKAITMSAWVFNEKTTGLADIISKGRDYTTNYGYHLRWGCNPQRLVAIYRLSNGENNIVDFSGLDNQTWYHVASTFDGKYGKLYVNGSIVNTTTQEGSIGHATTGFTIGAHSAGPTGWGYQWKGNIDEVGVWKRVLSADEIKNLYNNGKGLQYPF